MINNLIPYNFIFELPLYTIIPLDESNFKDFYELMSFQGSIHAYNPLLKENSTYRIVSRDTNRGNVSQTIGSYAGFGKFELICLRGSSYNITCFFYVEETRSEDWKYNYSIRKVGQYPSIADIHIGKVKEYNKVLHRSKITEFTKAIGLAANGVGIGSFVYLRRIFEDLIIEAHQVATQEGAIDHEAFGKGKMKEKIELLKNYLPEFLVATKHLYGILSLGIHELDEQDCLKHFEAVKLGIELILDEKVEKYEKKKRLEDAQKKLQEVNQELSKK